MGLGALSSQIRWTQNATSCSLLHNRASSKGCAVFTPQTQKYFNALQSECVGAFFGGASAQRTHHVQSAHMTGRNGGFLLPSAIFLPIGQIVALRGHCVRTACILRTQRPGYSPKNTCHLTGCRAKQQSPHENDETAFNLVLHCPYEQTTQPCKVRLLRVFRCPWLRSWRRR